MSCWVFSGFTYQHRKPPNFYCITAKKIQISKRQQETARNRTAIRPESLSLSIHPAKCGSGRSCERWTEDTALELISESRDQRQSETGEAQGTAFRVRRLSATASKSSL